MNREYEVHLCLNKGNEMLTKLTVKQDIGALQTKLDNIKKSWEKLKKTAVGRYCIYFISNFMFFSGYYKNY